MREHSLAIIFSSILTRERRYNKIKNEEGQLGLSYINVKSILGVIIFTLDFVLYNSRVKSKWEKQKLDTVVSLSRVIAYPFGYTFP
uniref:Uncharacterized protein n=1 Tax=Cucumis melo TaxID=3656 RepID=A0A9I9EK85_CUCME